MSPAKPRRWIAQFGDPTIHDPYTVPEWFTLDECEDHTDETADELLDRWFVEGWFDGDGADACRIVIEELQGGRWERVDVATRYFLAESLAAQANQEPLKLVVRPS